MVLSQSKMDDPHATLADWIRYYAKRQGVSLTDVSESAGGSKTYIWAVLSGDKSPTLRWLVAVATALRVEPWQLIRPAARRSKSR